MLICTGGGDFAWGQFRLGIILPGTNLATLGIPKAPSAIRPNDCNKATRHAPEGDSKLQHTQQHPDTGYTLDTRLPLHEHQMMSKKPIHVKHLRRSKQTHCRQSIAGLASPHGTIPPGKNFRHLSSRQNFPRGVLPWRTPPPPCAACTARPSRADCSHSCATLGTELPTSGMRRGRRQTGLARGPRVRTEPPADVPCSIESSTKCGREPQCPSTRRHRPAFANWGLHL